MTTQPKTYWRIHAEFTGVKKRARKVDRHTSLSGNAKECLLELPGDTDLAVVREKGAPLAADWIETNAKSVVPGRAFVTATFWTSDPTGLFSSETWEPMNEAHNKRWPVEVRV